MSNFGTALSSVAMVWFLLKANFLGNPAALVAGYWLMKILAELSSSLFIGKVVDQKDRKRIIVLTDFSRGIMYLLFPLYLNSEFLTKWGVYIFYFSVFSLSNLFQAAVFSAVPSIVKRNEISHVNSLLRMLMEITWLAGSALSGVLYFYFSLGAIFIFDGITFLISGFSEMFMSIPKHKTLISNTTKKNFSILPIIKKVIRRKQLRVLVLYEVLVYFFLAPATRIITPLLASDVLKVTSIHFGIFDSLMPAGAVVGALLFRQKSLNLSRSLAVGTLGLAFCFFSLVGIVLFSNIVLGSQFILFLLTSLVLFRVGMLQTGMEIRVQTQYQKSIEDNFLGRFFAFKTLAVRLSISLAFFLFGNIFHGRVELGYFFVALALFVLGFWFIEVKPFEEEVSGD